MPRNPPVANACPSDFNGTLIGYGPSTLSVIDNDARCGDGLDRLRRFAASDGWRSRINQPAPSPVFDDFGSVYVNEWTFSIITTCETYNGFTFGDSGGPLIGPNGNVCGVISNVRPFSLSPSAGRVAS